MAHSFTPSHVSLHVRDLSAMTDFYHGAVGLDIIRQSADSVFLGRQDSVILELHSRPEMAEAAAGQAGLYHFALLFSSRSGLAKTVERILRHAPAHFSGSADHLVSEAFYFNDPEGNGVELYFDRDKSLWQWENGQVNMATIYIEPTAYIRDNIVLEEKSGTTVLGHIHLKVGSLAEARHFYVDILGFQVTAELPGALFVASDGYHHHLGLNTWESEGAGQREESLGLKHFVFYLSAEADIVKLATSLRENNIAYQEIPDGLITHDPWRNELKIVRKFK